MILMYRGKKSSRTTLNSGFSAAELVANMMFGSWNRTVKSSSIEAFATHTAHSDYTSFTTPAEQWASNYVNLQMHLQLEAAKGAMFKWGVAAELRQGRQKFGSDVSMNWVF